MLTLVLILPTVTVFISNVAAVSAIINLEKASVFPKQRMERRALPVDYH